MWSGCTRAGILAIGISLVVALQASAAIPAGNLIGDPGAEQGSASSDETHFYPPPSPPWFGDGHRETQVQYGATGGFPGTDVGSAVGGGTAFFAGGPQDQPDGPVRQLNQSIDLSSYATDIDRGHVGATLSGLLGGYLTDGDSTVVTANFTDSGGDNTLLLLTIGPVTATDRNNVTTLLSRSNAGTLPSGVRQVDITVKFTRTSGDYTYNDGFADNLSLTLVDHTPPIVHTTSPDSVTQSTAHLNGTIDDSARPLPYHFEYGPSTSYGQSTATQTSAGTAGTHAVQASLGGLTAGTGYHARLVVDGPDGPVPGEDVSFTTTGVNPNAPGLPSPLDFTWAPRADVQIAGAPIGGLQFQATDGPGVTYAWDFDYHDSDGFVSDQTASGAAPKHGFTADGAHDTDKIIGADGQRRRVYTVRLRATAANGQTADVTHQLVVVPDTPPKVDFVINGSGGPVSSPVTFTPQVSDPDQTSRTADAIDHLEWSFDSPINGQRIVSLICAADGTNCQAPDGTAPGSWLTPTAGGGVQVDFWRRALAAHGLNPLGDLDINALPATLPTGAPLLGGTKVLAWTKQPFYVDHDPRAAYLYENATLLMQSSFNKDAGEATGAQYAGHQPLVRSLRAKLKAATPVISYAHIFDSAFLSYRQVTLTAVDTAGARTSVTHSLPLRPDQPPQLFARFVNASADGSTKPVAVVPRRGHGVKSSPKGQPLTQILTQPLTTEDELSFDPSGTTDPDGQIAYYTLEVGKPLNEPGFCLPGKPLVAGPTGKISLDPPDVVYLPGNAIFPGANPAATGPGIPTGIVGTVNVPTVANVKGIKQVGFRSAQSLPTLGSLLGTPYAHPCQAYSARNVVPGTFKAEAGPDVRPATRASQITSNINPSLLKRFGNLEYDTTAIVTSDPSKLRFRIPTPDTYSVAVGAYDKEGQGAIQRTDGFEIVTGTGKCSKISGANISYAGRSLGFSGLCVDFGSSRRYYWSTKEVDFDGVEVRPDGAHSAIFIDTCKSASNCSPTILATDAPEPDLSKPVDISSLGGSHAAGATVLVDGDAVANFNNLTDDRMTKWIHGADSAQPVVPAGATYKGSPVSPAEHPGPDATTFKVEFTQPEGASKTTFSIVMPTAFSIDGGDQAPTKQVVRYGFDEPRTTTLVTNKFADIARRKAHDRAVAHAAALATSGSIDLDGLWLGPVEIVHGNVSFDPAKGYFEVTADGNLWIPDPEKASIHIKIENGDLKEAGGSAETSLEVFPGVFLNKLSFNIVTDPLTLQGGAEFSAIKVLTGDINLTVRPEPLLLRLDGTIGISGIQLGDAFVQYSAAQSDSLTFGGHFGYNFGPVSMDASLGGGISFDTGDFYVEGSGHACFGYCLGVDALVSNLAVAACGSIDLGITSLSAGFAFTFAHDDLDIFTGCDLGGYIPAVFKTRAGPSLRADPRGGTLTVAPNTQQAAFRFTAVPGSTSTPVVTLTAPNGQQFTTTATPGDYAFSPPSPVGVSGGGLTKTPSALIDQDPVNHVTTFLVANPPAGDWTVTIDPSGPAVASSDVATGAHLPDATLQTKVEPAAITNSGGMKIGAATYAAGVTSKNASASKSKIKISPQIVKALDKLPILEDKRLRGVVLNIPPGLDGTLTLEDIGPSGVSIIRTLDVTKSFGKVPVAFDPSGDPGPHKLRAFLTHADGVPRQAIDVGDFTAPPLPVPSAPKLVVSRDPLSNVYVTVTPGTAGPLSGPITRFELIASTSAGQRIERFVDLGDAKKMSRNRFRVNLGKFASNVTVRAAGRMLYGTVAGSSTIKVMRAH